MGLIVEDRIVDLSLAGIAGSNVTCFVGMGESSTLRTWRGTGGRWSFGAIEEDIRECLQGRDFAASEGSEWRARRGVFEGVDNVVGASDDEIDGGGGGHSNVLREPCDGVGRALALGVPHVGAITTVVVEGGANVPSI